MNSLQGMVIADFSRMLTTTHVTEAGIRCTATHIATCALAQERVPTAMKLEGRVA